MRFTPWVVLALTFLAAGDAAAQYPLWARIGISDEVDVRNMRSADFNSDGRADVIARNGSQQIRLYLMTGDETGAATTVYTGTTLTDLLAVDVTGDGKADAVLAEAATDAIIVLPSNGDGTFGTPITSSTAVDPLRLAMADFNDDGKTDLAVRGASAGSSAVALYAGDGAGHFTLLTNRALTHPATVVEAGDIDGDGKGDYVVGYTAAAPYEVHFGNGDGTFEAPTLFESVTRTATRMALADLDADGDLEILIPHFATNTLTVIVNNGSRTFASPVVYPAMPIPRNFGNPIELIVGDVNGDGDADVVMTLVNDRLLATYTGNGDGSLNAGAYVNVGTTPTGESFLPFYLTAADFSGDGRIDIALASDRFVALWENVSGDVRVDCYPQTRTITAGQSVKLIAAVVNAQTQLSDSYPPPVATGTVIFRRAGVDVGSAVLSDGSATLEVSSLPLGVHEITGHYSGDDSYRETDSLPDTVHVIEESTTVTVSSTQAGSEVPYGQYFAIETHVTSEVEDLITGLVRLYVDDEPQNPGPSPNWAWYFNSLSVGTHTFRATYDGSPTQPPSASAVITQVVKKAASQIELGYGGDVMDRYSTQDPVYVRLSRTPGGGLPPAGTVRIYEGSSVVATANNVNFSALIPLSLPVGTHYLRATYEGNANYEPSSSALMKYVVFPDAGFTIDAWVQGSVIRVVGLYTLPMGGHFKIWRRIGTGAWTMVFRSLEPTWSEPNPQAGMPYTFRIEAYDSGDQLIATSNTDVAMLHSFTDDPLAAGTVIKSLHFTELVAAVNAFRGASGLGAISIDTQPGQIVRAVHLTQLANALNEARVGVGADAKSFAVTAAGSLIRASHVQELRDAIR